MPAYKHKNRAGKVQWGYQFSLPGSTRKDRKRVFRSGFTTKGAAIEAEAARRLEEQRKREAAKAGASVGSQLPKTLSMLLAEFFRQHVDEKLAPKTIERYHDQVAYLDSGLLDMPLTDMPIRLFGKYFVKPKEQLSKCQKMSVL